MFLILTRVTTLMNKKQKTPLQIIEKKYGKEPAVKSDNEIRVYLDRKGHKALSKLIEAK
jgi:hypothetical protein